MSIFPKKERIVDGCHQEIGNLRKENSVLKEQLQAIVEVRRQMIEVRRLEATIKIQNQIRLLPAQELLQKLKQQKQQQQSLVVAGLMKQIGFHIFTYLTEKKDRQNLYSVNKMWRDQGWYWGVMPYRGIKKQGLINGTISSKDHQSFTQKGFLGFGGCKVAYLVEDGQALLIPNTSADPLHQVKFRWKRIVKEEVAMSKFLSAIGILNPRSEMVTISFKYNCQQVSMPAYICQSFQALAENEHVYVIDQKNEESSMWKQRLFDSDEERNKIESWDPVVLPLVEDIKKLMRYRVYTSTDCQNMAVQKTDSGYVIRYFGFDFSSKTWALQIPTFQDYRETYSTEEAKELFETLFSIILDHEFDLYSKKEKLSKTEKKQMTKDEISTWKEEARARYKVARSERIARKKTSYAFRIALSNRYKTHFENH